MINPFYALQRWPPTRWLGNILSRSVSGPVYIESESPIFEWCIGDNHHSIVGGTFGMALASEYGTRWKRIHDTNCPCKCHETPR